MEELLRITEREDGVKTFSASELYQFLGYDKSQWSRWYKKNIVDDEFFVEGVDYQTFDIVSNGNTTKDFEITIDFAKEISMMARNEKGKQARLYFIECEKVAKRKIDQHSGIDFNNPDTVLKLAQNWADEHKKRIEAEKQLRIQQPKVEYVEKLLASKTTFSTTEVAADLGISAIKLNKALIDLGIIRRLSTGTVLTAKYLDRGYEYMLPIEKDGETKRQLRWTERGRAFINWKLGNKDYKEQTELELI